MGLAYAMYLVAYAMHARADSAPDPRAWQSRDNRHPPHSGGGSAEIGVGPVSIST